mgnify:CR=1 FL=1
MRFQTISTPWKQVSTVLNILYDNKMFEKETLSEYATIAADMNNDSKIDITDVVMLCNILFNK